MAVLSGQHVARDRLLGIALVLISAVGWSTAGVFMRLLALDLWTIVFWRAVFGSLALMGVAYLMRRGKTFGWPGLVGALLAAVSMLSFIAALKLTTVANVVVIYATLPFMAAGLARIVLGEPIGRRVAIASGVSLAGVVVVAGFALNGDDVLGNTLAFVMTATFAALLILTRRVPTLSIAAVNGGGAFLGACIAAPLMGASAPTAPELATLALFGCTTTAAAYLLFLIGSRYIPAGEAALISLLDVVLAPLWVWLLFAETPSAGTIVGGAVILSATIWYLWPTLVLARR